MLAARPLALLSYEAIIAGRRFVKSRTDEDLRLYLAALEPLEIAVCSILGLTPPGGKKEGAD